MVRSADSLLPQIATDLSVTVGVASIIVSAAFPRVPPPLGAQLAPGGRLVQPIGPGGHEKVMLFVERDGRLREEALVTAARFVPLIGEHGFDRR